MDTRELNPGRQSQYGVFWMEVDALLVEYGKA